MGIIVNPYKDSYNNQDSTESRSFFFRGSRNRGGCCFDWMTLPRNEREKHSWHLVDGSNWVVSKVGHFNQFTSPEN